VELHGATVGEVLAELGGSYGALYERLCDSAGDVRGHVNIYLNEVDIRRLGGLGARVGDGDEILLVPAIAGG
jgi:molybdopterin converting factor small subunit